jgi:putative thiamine transport system permease protein
LSLSGQWPYPELVPCCLKFSAWMSADYAVFETSVAIAILAAFSSGVIAVLWLESIPERFDPVVSGAAAIALILPAVLLFSGQYRAFLELGLTGTATGLFLAHLTPAFAYAWIVLKGPYRAFDPRYRAIAKGLDVSDWRFWWTAKMPLLRPALLSALAVGFAVSIAQFVGAQLMAAGRFSTLPIEAVTLASGGNRALTAAFALLLAIPPALAFLAVAWFSRPRWERSWA